jgi:hypothetical protein
MHRAPRTVAISLARFTGPRKGAFLYAEVFRMVVYTLKQADDGEWSICRMGIALFTQTQLGQAIKLARKAARDEHCRSGQPTCVEMRGLGSPIRLGYFDQDGTTTAA